MWTKTLKAKFKKTNCDVQIWFDGDYEKDCDKSLVKIQSMLNEYILCQEIVFDTRDEAYDFIKYYPVSMANSFLIREAYSTGAYDN